MKYIRTKDGRILKVFYENVPLLKENDGLTYYGKNTIDFETSCWLPKSEVINQADTIEELCDELVVVQKDFHDLLNADTHCLQTLKRYYEINKIEVLGIYGAIWTDKGLKFVARMNEKGELELL